MESQVMIDEHIIYKSLQKISVQQYKSWMSNIFFFSSLEHPEVKYSQQN